MSPLDPKIVLLKKVGVSRHLHGWGLPIQALARQVIPVLVETGPSQSLPCTVVLCIWYSARNINSV